MFNPTTIGKKGSRKPHPVLAFKAAVQERVRAYWKTVSNCPFSVECEYFFPRPASKTFKNKPNPILWHTAKPDRDNIDKAVYDCLTGIVWRDDSQIVKGLSVKYVNTPSGAAGVFLTIEELNEEVPL
jgi:Holliday junction resolvase RusA-like endonuclease